MYTVLMNIVLCVVISTSMSLVIDLLLGQQSEMFVFYLTFNITIYLLLCLTQSLFLLYQVFKEEMDGVPFL